MALGVAVAAVVLIGATIADAAHLYSSMGRVEADLPGSGTDGTTFLLVGSDSRAERPEGVAVEQFGRPDDVEAESADIILLLHVPAEGAPTLVSVPRDLIVLIPTEGPGRITLAFGGGPGALAQAICQGVGIGVDHVAIVHFDGFVELVDAVGGVDIETKSPVRDLTVDLFIPDAGVNTLDGATALAYVRGRHQAVQIPDGRWIPLPGADLRLEHSQEVARELSRRISSTRNPFALHGIATTAAGAVTVDEEMDLGDLRRLVGALDQVGSSDGDGAVVDLPVAVHDDLLPTSELSEASVPVLEGIGAGANPRCGIPPIRPQPIGPRPAEPAPTGTEPVGPQPPGPDPAQQPALASGPTIAP